MSHEREAALRDEARQLVRSSGAIIAMLDSSGDDTIDAALYGVGNLLDQAVALLDQCEQVDLSDARAERERERLHPSIEALRDRADELRERADGPPVEPPELPIGDADGPDYSLDGGEPGAALAA